MTTALYRRYRPESFADVIGQSHVTEPLMAALRADRVTHAYLFSGPRGCGKTTSARILARCLNCAQGPTDTPCGVCDSCRELSRNGGGSLDVVEIDAASHNGVDDARELRERAAFAPVRDRYKIFILDEAHMVTPQGFNALLKLVEEPPPHVKFIFATTEPERVIGTIRSRTHHYPFRLVPPEELTRFLEELCAREGVRVEGGVLPLVIRAGGGSVRDSLSVLDQLIAGTVGGQLDYRQAVALLGYTDETLLDQIVSAFAADDGAGVFRVVERVIGAGQEPRRFVEDLLQRLRDLLVVALTGENARDALAGLPADVFARMRDQAKALGAPALSAAADLTNEALTSMVGATSPRLHVELLCARVLLALGELQGVAPGRPAGQEHGPAEAAGRSRGIPAYAGQAASVAPAAGGTSQAGQSAPSGRPAPYADQHSGSGPRPAESRPAAPAQGGLGGASPADVIASAAADWGDDWSQPATPARGGGMDDAPPAPVQPAAAPSHRFDAGQPSHAGAPQTPSGGGARDFDASPQTPPAPQQESGAPGHTPAPRQVPPAPQQAEESRDWGTREFLPAEPTSHGAGAPGPQHGHATGGQREHWGQEPQRRSPQADLPHGSVPHGAVPQGIGQQRVEPQHGTTLSESGTAGQAEMIRARWAEVLGALRGISQVTWALVSANAHPGPVTEGTFAIHIPVPGILTAFHSRNMGEAVKQALRESLGLDLAVEAVPGGPANPGGPGGSGGPANPGGPGGSGGPANPGGPGGSGGPANPDGPGGQFAQSQSSGGQAHPGPGFGSGSDSGPGGANYGYGSQGYGGDAAPFVDSREAATDEPEENGRAHGHTFSAHPEPAPWPATAGAGAEETPASPPARPEVSQAAATPSAGRYADPTGHSAPAPAAATTPPPTKPAEPAFPAAAAPPPSPAPVRQEPPSSPSPAPVSEALTGEDDWPEVAAVGGASTRIEPTPRASHNSFTSPQMGPSVAQAALNAAGADAWPEVPSQLSSNFDPPAETEPWAPVHDIRSGRRIDGGARGGVVQAGDRENWQEEAKAAHPSAARPPQPAAPDPAGATPTPVAGTRTPTPVAALNDYDDNEISLDDPEVQTSVEAGVHVMLRVLGGQILEERDLTQN